MAFSGPRVLRADDAGGLRADTLRLCVADLSQGGLLVIPTETVYGLAADPRVPGSVDALYRAKGRAENKPVAFLGANSAQFSSLGVTLGGKATVLADRFWPGPLTLVVEGPSGFEGLRVPDHIVALQLLAAVGHPLAVTSANRSGEPAALTAEEAAQSVGHAACRIIDAGKVPGGQASTVVRVTQDRLDVLREGALPRQEIEGLFHSGA